MRQHWVRASGVAVGIVVAIVLAGTFSWALESRSYNLWGSMLVIPLVVILNGLILAHVTRGEADHWVVRIMWLGFAAKLAATTARYAVAYLVYGGAADAERYNSYAAFEYLRWRRGDVTFQSFEATGTQWLETVTTAVYTIVGPSPLTGFVVFAFLAFWGSYFFYRAFCVALPGAAKRRYAALVFLLPSILFWPASIGKESWLFFFIGLTAYGAAKMFSGSMSGAVQLTIGAVGTSVVRPHVAILVVGAVLVAQLFRPAGDSPTAVLSKLAGVAVIGLGVVALVGQSAEFLELGEVSLDSLSEEINRRSDLASQGGSEFESAPVTSLVDLPVALLTVIFRPFPYEAANAQMLMQSLEGVFLIGLAIASHRRLRNAARSLSSHPYLTFAVVYILGFAWAFSGIGNFGILARQRVLMLPIFLVLLAVPAVWPSVLRPGSHRATHQTAVRSDASRQPQVVQ